MERNFLVFFLAASNVGGSASSRYVRVTTRSDGVKLVAMSCSNCTAARLSLIFCRASLTHRCRSRLASCVSEAPGMEYDTP